MPDREPVSSTIASGKEDWAARGMMSWTVSSGEAVRMSVCRTSEME